MTARLTVPQCPKCGVISAESPCPFCRVIDHAVALEREALARWLESKVIDHPLWFEGLERALVAVVADDPRELIDAIRNGDHWEAGR